MGCKVGGGGGGRPPPAQPRLLLGLDAIEQLAQHLVRVLVELGRDVRERGERGRLVGAFGARGRAHAAAEDTAPILVRGRSGPRLRQRFLSGGHDKTVRVWLLNGTHQNTFRHLHTINWGGVTALVALPDNQHALSASADTTVKLFNVNDGAVLRTFTHHTRPNPVYSLALLPDGLRFVSGSHDNTARIVYHGLAPK